MIEKRAEILKVAKTQGTKLAKEFVQSIKDQNEYQNALMGKIASLSDGEVDELKPYAEIGEKIASYFSEGQEDGFYKGAAYATDEIMKIAQGILPEDQYNQFAGAVAPEEEVPEEDVEEVVNAATQQAAEEIVNSVQEENPEALEDPQVQQEITELAQNVGQMVGEQYLEQKKNVEQPQE